MREIPRDLNAEAGLISSILADGNAISKVSDINSEMFYDRKNQKIWEIIQKLYADDETIDQISVVSKMIDKSMMRYLNDISDVVLTAKNIENYAKLVKSVYKQRKTIFLLNSALISLYDNKNSFEEIVNDLQMKLITGSDNNKPVKISDEINSVLDEIQKVKAGDQEVEMFTTGSQSLDRYINLRRGKLMIIGGRPSHGKSIMAKEAAIENAKAGRSVLFISLEMSGQENTERMLSGESRVNYSKFENKKYIGERDLDPIIENAEKLHQLKIFFSPDYDVDYLKVKSMAANIKTEHGLDMIIVDYLQLMNQINKHENRERQIAETTRQMKLITQKLQVATILLTQLNRNCERRPGPEKMPTLADLRESGAIEQDADIVVFTMIPYKYGIEKINDEKVDKNLILTRIAKNRQGLTKRFIKHIFRGDIVSIMDRI